MTYCHGSSIPATNWMADVGFETESSHLIVFNQESPSHLRLSTSLRYISRKLHNVGMIATKMYSVFPMLCYPGRLSIRNATATRILLTSTSLT